VDILKSIDFRAIAKKAGELHKSGMNYQAIAENLKVSRKTIEKAIAWLNRKAK
jgi:orotate phosphoribosyltransferase-like protein